MLPTIAAPAVIVKILEPNKVSETAAQAIWNTCVFTAPLTLGFFTAGVAVVSLVNESNGDNFLKRLFKVATNDKGGFSAPFFLTIFFLWSSAWVSKQLFNIDSIDFEHVSQISSGWGFFRQISFFWLILQSYWNLYKPLKFFSSVFVAGFLVWVWTQKLWSHVRDAVMRLVKR